MKPISKNNEGLILSGSLPAAILSIAIPVIINSFLQTMYNLTDTYWLGQIGKEQLAAINLVTPVQSMVISFGSGFTVAGAILIAQYIGAGRDDQAKSMLEQIFACAQIFAFVCTVLFVALTPSIVGWLGAEGAIFDHSVTYLRIVILDMAFLFMINLYQSVQQAQGNAVRPMLLNLFGIVLNMILDPLLMIVLDMGVAGAAIATVIAKIIPAVIAFVLISHPSSRIRLELSNFHFDREKLQAIARIGLPTAIGGSAMQLGFLLMSRNVFAYGVDAMAAYGIGNKINGLISLPSNGIGSAVSTITAQNMGAGQTGRAERGYRMSLAGIVLFLLVGGLILSSHSVSGAIVGIFSSDASVKRMATEYLSILSMWCWTNGFYNATTGLFNGAGHTQVTVVIDAARLWVFRFATLYVAQRVLHLGVSSIWYSVVVSNALSAMLLLCLYFTGMWKKNRIKALGI